MRKSSTAGIRRKSKLNKARSWSLRFGARRLTDCLEKSAVHFAEEPPQMV
nr:MAG TPA: hypothetical protein [Caudoviricetes sp.]